jgi:integration host factor subunit alpha
MWPWCFSRQTSSRRWQDCAVILRGFLVPIQGFPMSRGYRGNALTRQLLREAVYKNIGTLSRKDARKLVGDVLDEMAAVLEQGETLKLRGFGTFKVRSKRERIGRNPKNGVEAVITPRRVITFKASSALFAKVNGLEPPVDDEDEEHGDG